MPAKTTLKAPKTAASKPNPLLAQLIAEQVKAEGFVPTVLPDVRFMHSPGYMERGPVSYDPSVVIIAQGTKRGRLGTRRFVYDAGNYLVLTVPLPFECETFGTPEEPMLGVAVRLNVSTIAELILEQDTPPALSAPAPHAIASMPLTHEISDAAVRLLQCMRSPVDARILGPQIIREITYRALCGGQGPALRALATPQSSFSQIARALRRIHLDYGTTLDVATLAREAGMSVSTFHANFKTITANSPLRYLQTIRLHKAQVLIVNGTPVAEAAHLVGYESPSQFSREFKRLFGAPPREIAERERMGRSMF